MPRVPAKDWFPDLPPLSNPGLTVADDCVPVATGFGPRNGWNDASLTAASEVMLAGVALRDSARNPNNFAGGATTLHRLRTDVADVSRASGYILGTNDTWSFAGFGNKIYAGTINEPIQVFDLQTSSLFADVTGNFVPRARHLAVTGNFLVAGSYYDSVSGSVPNGIAWSAIGNGSDWPEPGSDEAAAKNSDRQSLEGDGGFVHAVVAGAEVLAIFQERAIWRMDFRGGPTVFSLNRVEPSHGCLVPGLAVGFRRQVFFMAEEGFRIFDYTQSVAAGKERYDRYFLNDLDSTYLHRVTAVRDPDSTRIWVSYPGAGNSSGTPNKLLIYDYELNRMTTGDEALECLATFLPASTGTLDDPPLEDIDDTTGSFDDEGSAAGAYQLGGWDTNNKIGSMDGTVRDAVFTTGYQEFNPGMRSRVTSIRPLVDAGPGVTTAIAGFQTLSDTPTFGRDTPLTRSGDCPHRKTGRYHQVTTKVPGAAFVDYLGLDVNVVPEGRR